MRWLLKAAAFKALSLTPGGETIYRYTQKHLTRSIVPTKGMILHKLQDGMQYLELLQKIDTARHLSRTMHLDIGAGWMPTIPLLFYSVGVEDQVLCDVRRNMDIGIVASAVEIFREIVLEKRDSEACNFYRIPPLVERGEDLDEYFSRLGIRYVVPYGPGDLLREKACKLVTCTRVLLYLNQTQVQALFRMIASALADGGGIFVAIVNFYDHSISRYHKWRFSDFIWEEVINSRLMISNRLTAADYGRLLADAGFELLEFSVTEPTASDLEALRRVRIHEKFRHVPESELAAPYLFFAAKLRS